MLIDRVYRIACFWVIPKATYPLRDGEQLFNDGQLFNPLRIVVFPDLSSKTVVVGTHVSKRVWGLLLLLSTPLATCC